LFYIGILEASLGSSSGSNALLLFPFSTGLNTTKLDRHQIHYKFIISGILDPFPPSVLFMLSPLPLSDLPLMLIAKKNERMAVAMTESMSPRPNFFPDPIFAGKIL
jgi:hypothetical protein